MTAAPLILIVDDSAPARFALAELLRDAGYQFAFAEEGPAALQLAAKLRPDLILLDVMLPGLDGFEVCRRLRADPALAEIPVIMLTVLDDQAARLQGLEAGADDFLSKPYSGPELRARVHTITRLNRFRRLAAERLRLAEVLEHAAEGYLLLGAGNTVTYLNPAARRLLGLDGEPAKLAGAFLELAGRHFHPEPAAAWETWPPATPETPPLSRYLIQPESPHAATVWLKVEDLDDGAAAGAERLICLRDITAQVTEQRDMRRFHHVVSHKLRAPLIPILGGLEVLTEQALTLPRDAMAEMAGAALIGARRLHATVEDILLYLNPPLARAADYGFSLAGLPALLAELAGSLGLTAPALELPPELAAARLTLTASAVTLILAELLENTQKFHPAHAPHLQASLHAGQRQVLFRLTDDGRHLSSAQLARVWEPYYQGEKSFTGQVAGQGLGLPLVAALVWEAGGRCRLSNRLDEPGVIVELALPIQEGEGHEQQQTANRG